MTTNTFAKSADGRRRMGTVDGGYAAVSFDTADGWHYLEVQVHPDKLFVYISSQTAYRARRAVWAGANAAAIGRAVCAGECSPAILADWCDDHEPASRGRDFDAAAWLRKA